VKKTRNEIFIHDTVENPSGQRGVNRVFMNYTKAILGKYPNKAIIYSKNDRDFDAGKLVKPLGLKRYPRLNKYIGYRFDELIKSHYLGSCKLYFSPYYGNLFNANIQKVYIAHDMIYEKYFKKVMKNHAGLIGPIKEKKNCFQNAELIICVSNYTKKDIQQIYPHIPSSRLSVIYNGVEEVFFSQKAGKKTEKPYFIYIGNRTDYKNFKRFLTAYGKSGVKDKVDLLVISPYNYPFQADEKNIITQFNLGDFIKIKSAVSDQYLAMKYSKAHALVFPSIYEGFGLPILEAMACGTIVLSSNATSIPEIGGDIPVYFDPYSIDEMVYAIRLSLEMPEATRQHKILEGQKHARKFTWENTRNKFVNLISPML